MHERFDEVGTTKNDCERNAAKRLLDDLRREHPHMKAVIVEGRLASSNCNGRLREIRVRKSKSVRSLPIKCCIFCLIMEQS